MKILYRDCMRMTWCQFHFFSAKFQLMVTTNTARKCAFDFSTMWQCMLAAATPWVATDSPIKPCGKELHALMAEMKGLN